MVMAHPDDETLWASSILARVGRVLLCYEEAPFLPTISAGRRQALAAFPRPNVRSLGLPEAMSFDAAAWPEPVETEYGLELRQGALPGFSAERYRTQFVALRDQLRGELAGCSSVITHNPWGEYGHEDHVQVFRAVAALAPELDFSVWVSCYCSNRSLGLMQRNLPGLGAATPPLSTDLALAAKLKALYTANGCWTWPADYTWPAQEVFYRWHGGTAATDSRVHPLNFIWMTPEPPRTTPLRRGLRALRRRVGALRRARP